jgi:hypothetical protein
MERLDLFDKCLNGRVINTDDDAAIMAGEDPAVAEEIGFSIRDGYFVRNENGTFAIWTMRGFWVGIIGHNTLLGFGLVVVTRIISGEGVFIKPVLRAGRRGGRRGQR